MRFNILFHPTKKEKQKQKHKQKEKEKGKSYFHSVSIFYHVLSCR